MIMDVVVVGSCNMDLISYTPRLPKPGETLHGHRFVMGFGGKGANQCVICSRLGAKVAMVAKVGKDSFGNDYLKNFEENHVNIEYVGMTSEASTGVAPIAVDETGQNSIIIVSGANLLLSTEDIQRAASVIQSAKVVVCQLEISLPSTVAALKLAKEHGVKTIFNPAPAVSYLDPEIYGLCDIFCLNETEAEILTGQSVLSITDADKAVECLLGRECQVVILTMGDQGSVYASQIDKTLVHVPAQKVDPVDTTGAGDAFIGGLAYYLARHPQLGLKETIMRAGKIATISVQAKGTQSSYPWKKDVPSELFAVE